MNILFLEPQPCIRALKYGLGLKANPSMQISFAYTQRTLDELYGKGNELFEEWIKLEGEPTNALRKILQERSFDLVHSHNAPDNLAVAAINALRAMGCRIPLIHDVHDMMSLRKTPYGKQSIDDLLEDEKIALRESNGLILVSKAMQDMARERYLQLPPNIVFPNYLPESLVPNTFKEKLSNHDGGIHIVYEGTLDSNTGSHYDLIEIFRAIAQQGLNIHIYPSKEHEDYNCLAAESPFIHYHKKQSPQNLMEEITQYDYGWAGFNGAKNREHLETVLPNKAVEYVAAGLPVIAFDYRSLKEFIEGHKVGMICTDINELGSLLRSPRASHIKEKVKGKRLMFTLEKNIPLIEDFYHQALRHSKLGRISEEEKPSEGELAPAVGMEYA